MDQLEKIFLTAAWKNLVMANYIIDPVLLKPYLPAHTTIDEFEGNCYISLVGFMFENVKVKGISIPFHTHFPEVNLRFYVKHTGKDGAVKRGVVFISEIVPRRAIAWVANTIYKEKYLATTMQHAISATDKEQQFSYSWQWKGKTNRIAAGVQLQPVPIREGSPEEFIFEHYYGFAKVTASITNMYTVEHPSWQTFIVNNFTIDCAFEQLYGSSFAFMDTLQPASVLVADGSAVGIRHKIALRYDR